MGCSKAKYFPPKDQTERINYKDFKKVGEQFKELSDYFKATTFLNLIKINMDVLKFLPSFIIW